MASPFYKTGFPMTDRVLDPDDFAHEPKPPGVMWGPQDFAVRELRQSYIALGLGLTTPIGAKPVPPVTVWSGR